MPDYKKAIDRNRIKPKYFKNGFIAFVTGGAIGVLGQGLVDIYMTVFAMPEKEAQTTMLITLILTTAILTGIGIYDKFGDFAGAGSFVPITGFSNAMTSSALEGKSEGIILGIGGNMFKLAGSVIALGVSSAYIVGMIRYLFFM